MYEIRGMTLEMEFGMRGSMVGKGGMLQMYFICAVHVSELSRDDWLRLTAFQSLRDLEKRRLLRAAGR